VHQRTGFGCAGFTRAFSISRIPDFVGASKSCTAIPDNCHSVSYRCHFLPVILAIIDLEKKTLGGWILGSGYAHFPLSFIHTFLPREKLNSTRRASSSLDDVETSLPSSLFLFFFSLPFFSCDVRPGDRCGSPRIPMGVQYTYMLQWVSECVTIRSPSAGAESRLCVQ